ncbi:hypothetical protein, partial [Pseudomonas gingeri]|uniref:hypothetical protein n=1 Tax=Pseudomonas gingeri TaxID=117681 RepID=UPI0034E96387
MNGAVDQAALPVEHGVGGQVESCRAEYPALVLVVEGVGGDGGLPLAAQGAALIVQGLGGGDVQVTAGDDVLAGVVELLRRDADVAFNIAGVIGIDPGLDNAVVGQLAAAGKGDAVLGDEVVLTGQVTLGFHIQSSTGVERALGFQAISLDVDRARRRRVDHA